MAPASSFSFRRSNSALRISFAVLGCAVLLGCGKKAKECDSLITSMNDLGAQVGLAQRTADRPDAKPGDLIAVLRPLSVKAKTLADKLSKEPVTTESVKKLAVDFEKFSTNLALESEKIAASAASLESAQAVADSLEQAQKAVEKAQADLEKSCTGNPTACVPIADLLTKLPSGPTSADDAAQVKKWREDLATWLKALRAAPITDEALKKTLEEFDTAWTRVAEKMGELSTLTETARSVEAAGKRFDSLIDEANLVITNANRECGREETK